MIKGTKWWGYTDKIDQIPALRMTTFLKHMILWREGDGMF